MDRDSASSSSAKRNRADDSTGHALFVAIARLAPHIPAYLDSDWDRHTYTNGDSAFGSKFSPAELRRIHQSSSFSLVQSNTNAHDGEGQGRRLAATRLSRQQRHQNLPHHRIAGIIRMQTVRQELTVRGAICRQHGRVIVHDRVAIC